MASGLPVRPTDWQPIGRTSRQVVLRHWPSGAVTVQSRSPLITDTTNDFLDPPSSVVGPTEVMPSSSQVTRTSSLSNTRELVLGSPHRGLERLPSPPRPDSPQFLRSCPYCYQIIPEENFPNISGAGVPRFEDAQSDDGNSATSDRTFEEVDDPGISPAEAQGRGRRATQLFRTQPYFRILEHSINSRPPTPVVGRSRENTPLQSRRGSQGELVEEVSGENLHREGIGVEGYYKTFFVEEKRLGMGAQGSVFLCQHVLDGNFLSYHAVKKVAIGASKAYLVQMLNEVRLLEGLRHRNIIPYEHVWIEPARFSRLAPPIDTLHILMMYANYGNLDTFIASRCSSASDLPLAPEDDDRPMTADERKKLFKRRMSGGKKGSQPSPGGDGSAAPRGDVRGVLLLNREEVESLFGDVVEGLAFLHSKAILHLDLKCPNVLLHLFDGDMIPTAMISDFGSSRLFYQHSDRKRTGETGTMEYVAPETITPDSSGNYREMDSKVDIWGLGLILYKLLFFRLPYSDTQNFDDLEREIKAYPGFVPLDDHCRLMKRRGIPIAVLDLLAEMLSVDARKRPQVAKIADAWRRIRATAMPSNDHDRASSKFTNVSDNFNSNALAPYARGALEAPSGGTINAQTHMNPVHRLDILLRFPGLKVAIAAIKILSVLPPFRTIPLMTIKLNTTIILALGDLLYHDVRFSLALLLLHIVLSIT